MHLVEDDQALLVICQVELRVGKSGTVRGRFQVEVDGVRRLTNLEGQRRFADLARTEQSNSGVLGKQTLKLYF